MVIFIRACKLDSFYQLPARNSVHPILYVVNKVLPSWDVTVLARCGVLQTPTDDSDRQQRAKQYWPIS